MCANRKSLIIISTVNHCCSSQPWELLQINDFQGQEDGAVQLENKQGFVLLPLLIWVITDFGFQHTVKESIMIFMCTENCCAYKVFARLCSCQLKIKKKYRLSSPRQKFAGNRVILTLKWVSK